LSTDENLDHWRRDLFDAKILYVVISYENLCIGNARFYNNPQQKCKASHQQEYSVMLLGPHREDVSDRKQSDDREYYAERP
jgi:hypothetical protein